jgi:hypothetical protein
VIKEIKDVLEAVVSARIPGITVARSALEESHAIMARKWPLVSLITNPGRFDDREARLVRYADTGEGGRGAVTWKQRTVRGTRRVPILLRCWNKGEDATDEIFSRIIPAIPRRWDYDGFQGFVLIGAEEHSDHTDSVTNLYLSMAEIQFTVDVALEETIVPTIDTTEIEPGASANRL